jgi:hypothetical protein
MQQNRKNSVGCKYFHISVNIIICKSNKNNNIVFLK